MDVVSRAASSPIRRVATLCGSPHAADSRVLRLALLAEIGAVVPFHAYAWLLTDPETSVGTSPLADVPATEQLPALIRSRYQSPANRWTAIDDPPVALLSTAENPRGEWAAMLRQYGVSDVATAVFRDRYGCWGFLDLWRSNGPFTSAEEQLLAAVAPAITAALRGAQAAAFSAPRSGGVPGGPVVLVLSADLEVTAQTPESERQLRRLVPPDGDAPAVPASAYNVGAQLLAVELGIDANLPSARVHLGDGTWVTARAARLGHGAAGEIAVTIEPSSSTERLAVFGLACGLSEREREILALVAGGGSTREIAGAAFVSEHTVQDHLKAIFVKTSTHSRRELVSHVLGN